MSEDDFNPLARTFPLNHSKRTETLNAQARLARNQVVGMIDYLRDHTDYEKAAFQRFVDICHPPKGQERHLYNGMIYTLTEARATINFSVKNFFLQECSYGTYLNMFERITNGAPAPHDVKHRNDVEKRIFDYQGRDKYVPTPVGGENMAAAKKQIQQYGTKWQVAPMMRPRYAALDYAYCVHGGAGRDFYGTSYFVLKHYMKTSATYSHCDSFYVERDLSHRKNEYGGRPPSAHQAMARIHEMPKLLYYCHPVTLRQIYRYCNGSAKYGSELTVPGFHKGMLNYIEIQLHTDVLFSRDIALMVISRSDIERSVANFTHKAYQRMHIQKYAEIFARKHGFPVSVVA